MKKPAIPAITVSDKALAAILAPMKESIEQMRGQRGQPPIEPLRPDATNAEIIRKINDIIRRLQG